MFLLYFEQTLCCVPYLCDGHLRVLLLLLQLLLKELQVVLRRQGSERRRAAGSDALGCHGEEGPSIKVLEPDKTQEDKKKRKTNPFY